MVPSRSRWYASLVATGASQMEDPDLSPTDAAYDDQGVDRSLIRYCLGLTPTERMAENEAALALAASAREPVDAAVASVSRERDGAG